jgi:hypothetical protein
MAMFRRQIVCNSGQPRTKPGDKFTKWLVAFWFEVPPAKRVRRDMRARPSQVADAMPFEAQALADGALLEVMTVFQFPLDMPMAERRRRIDQDYRTICLDRLGFLPAEREHLVVGLGAPEALAGDRSAST